MIMRAGLWAFAGKLGAQFTRLFLVVVLARLLTPEAFGVVAAAQIVIALSEVVVRFGLGAALIQRETLTPRIEGTALTLVLLLTTLICAVLLGLRVQIAALLNIPELVEVMPVLLLAFVVAAITNPSTNLIAREMQYRFLAGVDVATYAIGYGLVAVVLAWLGFSYWALILGTLAQNVTRAALILYRRPVVPVLTVDRAEVAALIRFGGGVFLSQMLNTLARRSDNAIVSSMFGAAALGFYSRAYALMDMSNTLLGSVFREVLFSGFAKKRRESGADDVGKAFLMAHTFAALIMLPVSAVILLLADAVVTILLGRQWAEVVPLLEVLALGMYFRLASKVSGTFNLASGDVYGNVMRNAVYLANVLALGFVGASVGGVAGVAWGVLGALACHFVLTTHFALRQCGQSWSGLGRALAPLLLAGLAASSSGAAVVSLGGGVLSEPLTAGLAVLAYLMAYAVPIVLMRRHPVLSTVLRRFLSLMGKLRGRKTAAKQ